MGGGCGIPAILEFGLVEGRNIDAVVAARALIEWTEAIREAARIVDPTGSVSVTLLSAEPACLRFSTVLKFVEEHIFENISEKLAPYPHIKQFLALNVLILPGAVIGGMVVNAAMAEDPAVAEKQQQVADSPIVQQRVRTFYRIVQTDTAIKNVAVRQASDGPPIILVDRSEFAERSGLWEADDDPGHDRAGGGVWDVVVTHPVAISKPRVWRFMRDGLPFQAKMVDRDFLKAIKNGTLPLVIQEGLIMKVRVSYRERLDGQIWLPIKGTYQIDQVLSPTPND